MPPKYPGIKAMADNGDLWAIKQIYPMKIDRTWAMPSPETFSIEPIREFVQRYLSQSKRSIDPFARNCGWATDRNDLNPETSAQYHMDAEEFCKAMSGPYDLALFDPPYSPRQISECYKNIGLDAGTRETQNGHFYKRVRDALDELIRPGGIVLSFGWNSIGMGKTRGYELAEILLVAHGGAHNDTICLAERKIGKST